MAFLLDGSWDVGTFLENAGSTLKDWGGGVVLIIGVVMVIVGVVKLFWGLANHGKTQSNYLIIFLLIVIGGAFISGGWSFVEKIAKGGKQTIEDLGEGKSFISPFFFIVRNRFF